MSDRPAMSDHGILLRIAQLRAARGLTQTELAERTGMTVSMMGKIERGDRDASMRSLAVIASALGIEVPDLFHRSKPAVAETDVND